MAQSCTYIPRNKKGEELKGFQDYKSALGYKTAAKVFTQVISPDFQNDFRKDLSFDSQGVPTYNSVIKIPYIKKLIGNSKLIEVDQRKFPVVENTRENYQRLLQTAYSYNQSSPNKDNLVAVVTLQPDGKGIQVEIRENNEQNKSEFRNQYSSFMLNQRLLGMFEDLGITVELLESNELTDGFVDFSKASGIADGLEGLINIADGMEGEIALSEECSHVLIGMFRNHPIVQRSLNVLMRNDALLREVLGDEYERNKTYYQENPNYDALGNEVSLEETLAEEALGKILRDKLKTGVSEAAQEGVAEENSKPLNNLVKRFINWIKKTFKGRSSDDIRKAKNEVNQSMGELAKGILTGTEKLSKEELIKNKRKAKFHFVREQTDSVIKLLNSAINIERKRSKIVNPEAAKKVKGKIRQLESMLTDISKMHGLFNYAQWALKDLEDAMESLNISGTLETHDFQSLRDIKTVLDSYSGFIEEMHEALDDIGYDASTIVINGEEVDLRKIWSDLDDLYKSCRSSFNKQAFVAFSDFMAPIYEKSPLRNADGSIKSIEDVLTEEDFDISEFDRWLTSMGNSSSILLQLYDKAVKNAKDKIHDRMMSEVRKIWSLQERAEKRGITTFEWMYEKDSEGHKTGNYISLYNRGQYEKDKQEMLKNLTEKYGKRPTGEDFKKAYAEKKAWYEEHALVDEFGNDSPNNLYLNPEYNRLSQAQKDTLAEILEYKAEKEKSIPAPKRDKYRAIQRRRTGSQRLADSLSNPAQAVESIKDDLAAAFNTAEDDDLLYGESTQGLTDFTGKEYLTLPILYTHRLKNPDTLSTDIFSDLMCYANMTVNYSEMSRIYNPLEIGLSVIENNKTFVKRKDGKIKEEIINVAGRVTKRAVRENNSLSFEKKLRDYLESQVYGRYMKEDDVVSAATQKKIGVWQRMTSAAYLGLNALQGIANIATAVGMQNIEAAGREFFSAKNLAWADKEYAVMLPEFISELGARNKQSKLALFDELFDVRQNRKDKLHNVRMKSIFRRFFGNNWLFIQQGMGDHWIYNRTALAMAKHKQVMLDGKIVSLWDALEIVTDESGYKKMRIKEGTMNIDKDGNITDKFDRGAFTREIAHINHTIAGIYNDDDQNAANRVIVGRLVQQMRKWIVPQMMRRFQSKRTILDIGREEEGYYRTAARFAKDLWVSGFKITAEWNSLSDSEKANVRRALAEIIQTYALWLLASLLGSGVKDPDKVWAAQFAEYILHREIHELGFLTPGPMMATEGLKTLQSPFVCASSAEKMAQAMLTTMWPGNWFPDDDDLIKSGKYEGHSHIYKRWAETPLPFLTQIKQIDKFINDLDSGTKWYSRDYK